MVDPQWRKGERISVRTWRSSNVFAPNLKIGRMFLS
ncbi:hypothetical protein SLEP1_g59677 [Rubroshorea leprosula]|uniref:Uncharacterized protein n=1 Tax=Rubroshorea leprosula TaxID=152421 RepID=A0AAV5MUC4_9ROSI|nr:hypothetical protein SLEP1_g59677 [Rubroshorea leprosula]